MRRRPTGAEPSPIAAAMRSGLAIYLMGIFVGALDVNVLGPALPLIAHGFHTTLAWTAWTVTAYTVAYAASTVLAGAIGDRVGRPETFRVGLLLFGAASVIAALAPSFLVFVLARVIQGVGAGVVYPNAQAQGVQAFPREKRGLALGLFGAVFGLASIIGPNVGGALAQFVGWPAIFWFNVAASATVFVAALRLQPAERSERPMPDVAGGLAFAALLGGGLMAIAAGGIARVVCAAVAVGAAVVFARRQRGAAVPFLDSAPLVRASGATLMAGAALIGFNMASAVFVPDLAQRELGLGILASGFALMPAALSGAVMAGVGGVLVDRIGARKVLLIGLGAGVAGGVLLSVGHMTLLLFGLAMVAFGLATAFTMGAPLNRMAIALYPDAQAGEALSLVAVFRSIGLAAGPIVLTMAQARDGFTGMFGAVAVACAVAVVLFVRMRPPAPRVANQPA